MNSAFYGSVSARQSAGRPVIGICARTAPVTLQGIDMTVSLTLQPHVDFLASAGCTPVLLPLLPGVEHLIGQLGGLLVPGGPDVDPALYGGTAHPRTRTGSPVMDAAELALVKGALSAGLPILAICRGMQLLNVHCGGTLHQHLPEITGNDGHCPQTGPFTLGRHRLDLKPGSRIAGILGDGTPETSCHHHQGINQRGTGLTAGMTKAGGVLVLALILTAVHTPSLAVTALIGAIPLLLAVILFGFSAPETHQRRLEDIAPTEEASALPEAA